MTASRWDAFAPEEMHMVHHALRMLGTHPLPLKPEEEELRERLADEIWDLHCSRSCCLAEGAG